MLQKDAVDQYNKGNYNKSADLLKESLEVLRGMHSASHPECVKMEKNLRTVLFKAQTMSNTTRNKR